MFVEVEGKEYAVGSLRAGVTDHIRLELTFQGGIDITFSCSGPDEVCIFCLRAVWLLRKLLSAS